MRDVQAYIRRRRRRRPLIGRAHPAAGSRYRADGADGADRTSRSSEGQAEEAADAGSDRRPRADEEVRRRMEGSQGCRQGRQGTEVAAVLERLQQAPQDRRQGLTQTSRARRSVGSERPIPRELHAQRSAAPKTPRASARLNVSPTPSDIIRNRAPLERLRIAHHPMTRTGPYDATFNTCVRRSGSGVDLELLLPLLGLLRRLHCLLSTFRHCCPPSHEVMAVSHQCGRESTCTAFRLLQQNEKSSVPLNEECTQRAVRGAFRKQGRTGGKQTHVSARAKRARLAQQNEFKNMRWHKGFFAVARV